MRNIAPIARLCRSQADLHQNLTNEISQEAVAHAIRDRETTGNGNIPSGIPKENTNACVKPIPQMTQSVGGNEIPNTWKQGIVMIRKKDAESN